MLKKKTGGKKKIVAVLLGVDLSRALPCPIFSQIFSVFGNKDSAFFIKIADFAPMGPQDCLLPWPSYMLPHPWCENTVSYYGVKVAASKI